MRFFLTGVFAVAILGVSAVAHADTVGFTYTPTGGSAITFSLATATNFMFEASEFSQFSGLTLSNGDIATIYFENPAFASAVHSGPVNFLFQDVTTETDVVYTGVQLFSGPESAPIFADGQYALLAAPVFGSMATGTLAIQNVATPVSPAPEPSSLVLLATGVLGLAGKARRRFAGARSV